ncbi:MAG: hypothetical protein ACJ76W_02385 [Chloroflexota bacterium]
MHNPAMILATAKINDLHAEAAAQRLAKKNRSARGSSRGRLAAAASNVRSFLSGPIETTVALPTLTDYPFRS